MFLRNKARIVLKYNSVKQSSPVLCSAHLVCKLFAFGSNRFFFIVAMDRTIVILATESKIVFYLSALSQSQHRNYVTLRAVYYTMVNNREVFLYHKQDY